jgi:predicted transcriptional regulator
MSYQIHPKKQKQIQQLAKAGMSNADIAKAVGVSVPTASRYAAITRSELNQQPPDIPGVDDDSIVELQEAQETEVGSVTMQRAIDAAARQLQLQEAEMQRCKVLGDGAGYARASRLVIAASQLLGRLLPKDQVKGLQVTEQEVTQARESVRAKLREYIAKSSS